MLVELGDYVLEDLTMNDDWPLYVLTSDPKVTKYMGFRTHTSIDDARAMLRNYATSPTRFLGVHARGSGRFLGVVGLQIDRHQAALTIMFGRSREAMGAGRRVAVPLVQWIFSHASIFRVSAFCHVDNVPAQRVMERMGAACEGRLRRFETFPNISAEPQDAYVYSIVRG
jgi:ribosomal-protein-alanine N-acetyltransferase